MDVQAEGVLEVVDAGRFFADGLAGAEDGGLQGARGCDGDLRREDKGVAVDRVADLAREAEEVAGLALFGAAETLGLDDAFGCGLCGMVSRVSGSSRG